MRIYLVGFMGAGKSFFGKKLAETLSFSFLDLDNLIEEGEQKSIADIFSSEGEAYFRLLEKKYLATTASLIDVIVATGGGTACYHQNMDWIKQNGWCIFLEASPTLLAKRLYDERSKRPIVADLADVDLLPFIIDLLEKRTSYYEQAHLIIHQDYLKETSIDPIVNVLKQLIL